MRTNGIGSGPLIGSTHMPAAPVNTAELKAVMREVLGLDTEDTVVVQELACSEPGCPPVETVFAALSPQRPARRWTVHAPLAQVTVDQLRAVLARGSAETG